jgi:hypothetical protein
MVMNEKDSAEQGKERNDTWHVCYVYPAAVTCLWQW